MSAPYLTLQLSDKTLKKLRALAMLSGSTVDQLEKDFADYFDQMLTENIAALLAQLDGKEYVAPEAAPAAPERHTSPEEVVESVAEAATEHALSEDELPEEVKSTAEAVEEEIQPPQYSAPNAGNNAESFLDAALSQPEPRQQAARAASTATYMGMPVQSVKRAFNPNAPRARVSEYTGNETDLL